MITTLDETEVHVTPNATMRRYPGTEVAVWRTEMAPAARGPLHRIDVDQVVVVLEGGLEVTVDGSVRPLGPGDSMLLAAGCERQLVAGGAGAVTLSAAVPGGIARVGDGEPVVVPWSA